MIRHNDTTHALFKIVNALLLVLLVGCEELGIGPQQDSATNESVASTESQPAPAQPPVQTAPVEPTAAPVVTPEAMVADFIATRSDLITDDMVVKLSELTPANSEVTSIDLRGAKVTQAGLRALARLPQLRSIDLSGCTLPVSELAAIGEVTQIETLVLENAALNNMTVAVVAPLRNLKSLNISNTNVTDEGFQHLTKLSELQTILCQGLMITGGGFEAFTGKYANASLREINVNNTMFGQLGFRHLTGMKHLELLSAGNAQVTDDALKGIRGCTELRILQLSGNNVTDQGFKLLNGLKSLETLDVDGNKLFSDFTLDKLDSFKTLKTLKIQDTACTLAGIQKLKQAIPDCVVQFNNTKY